MIIAKNVDGELYVISDAKYEKYKNIDGLVMVKKVSSFPPALGWGSRDNSTIEEMLKKLRARNQESLELVQRREGMIEYLERLKISLRDAL